MSVLIACLILLVLGALLGIGLSIASKKFAVEKDPKLEALEAMMPGANCGGCGYAGCSAYANAVFSGEAAPGLCAPGGQALANKMSEVMGVEAEEVEKKVAYVFCQGSCSKTVNDFEYKGLEDCNAAALLFNGEGSCKYGCLHLGSCMQVCPENAISRDEDGQLTVDREKCIGCGKCTKVCPHNVIKLIPANAWYVVACNSHDNGAKVRKVCEAGCIGCKICETKFPESGFKVDSFLAVADYSANPDEQAKAAAACPRKIIRKAEE